MPRRSIIRRPTRRDVLLLDVPPAAIVVACDSSGGVGGKRDDKLRVSGSIVGRYAARTVAMEILCAGARIIGVAASLAVEYEPSGRQILAGIRQELRKLGYIPPMTWSTEKNFEVKTTGVGITAVGSATTNELKIGRSKPGDSVMLVGVPSVGSSVLEAERNRWMPTLKDALSLSRAGTVHEVIPVGSTGVLHEAKVVSEDSCLSFEPSVDATELRLSGGPSTALVVTTTDNRLKGLGLRCPVHSIGVLL